MREKVRDLIYLDTNTYMSIDTLRVFYWGIIVIPFFMVVIGIVSIKMTGVNFRSLFPLVSIAIWSLLYWIFVLTIQSKKTKKNFELRFFVNGMSGLFISSLIWIFMALFNLVADTPFLKFDFMLWIGILYLLFSLIYVFVIVLCVHRGVFALIKEKGKTKKALKISAFFGALIPGSGLIGIYASRMLRAYDSISAQHSIMAIFTILSIFLPALAHINFVQFYYCKKYGIDCDEHGNTTSPELERKPKKVKKVKKSKKTGKNGKKKMPLFFKVIIGIVCTPIATFILMLFIGFLQSL